MNLTISDEAVSWYLDEMNLHPGDHVRFYARYGGSSKIQSGFSLGIDNEAPFNPATTTEKNGITFYIEEDDLWFFDGHDLSVYLNDKYGEPDFQFDK
ncbi:HesB/YadR/YfhF family protein [Bacillus sp. V59.32b]|uniref:HesB/YadR/YfhF family protein n=1 Tax=Bacillus sp. V59.32b TaxID=1758642 RepID=UPI000E3EC58A|nr:HesB/YadR/YfhF family protein [Bacillus sp. V59.32b]RFU68689.1 hypothetical protein D0463_04415 [Bacillus sp. V59.32b]